MYRRMKRILQFSTKLNEAGDRKYGDFDFFSLTQTGSSFSRILSAQYNTLTGVLTRK